MPLFLDQNVALLGLESPFVDICGSAEVIWFFKNILLGFVDLVCEVLNWFICHASRILEAW